MTSLREEQLARIIAECASPLRAAAAAYLELIGKPAPSPKEALVALVREIGTEAMQKSIAKISQAREKGMLPAGEAATALFDIMHLLETLLTHIERSK